jgi:hypothetical protein
MNSSTVNTNSANGAGLILAIDPGKNKSVAGG